MFDLENAPTLPSFDSLIESSAITTVDVDEEENDSIAKQISTVFSASAISAIMSHPEMDSLPTAGQQYVQRKFANRKNGTFNSFSTKATEHGNKFEHKAIEEFERVIGFVVQRTGENQICLTYGENCVAHPDGIIFNELGRIIATVEAKCPYNREIHESYLKIIDAQSLKAIAPNYYWQVCNQQLSSETNLTYFISFDPKPNEGVKRLHYAMIVVPVNDLMFMKKRIQLAEEYLHLLENEDANTVAFKPSDAPIIEIAQLPRVQIDIGDVAIYHNEPAALIQKIANQAGSLVFDMTSAKGRDACRSHASQIIKCIKPALDASKQLASDAKRVIEKDLAFRKEFEAGVREIADHHRRPLTEWEAEQERIEREKREEIERLAAIEQAEIDYQAAHESALAENELFDLRREKQAREKAEFERLAEEQRKEREAKAVADAIKEKEQQLERQRIESERRAQEAEQRALHAAQAERERMEREQAEQERIERERTENEAHRKFVHNEIFRALCENGVEREVAKQVTILAIEQKLGRLQISY
ncbi:MAG: YqaJ viral recombinase family protein [Methylococcaceae bacterium]